MSLAPKAPKPSRWLRGLHRTYHRGEAMRNWFARRIRPAGVGVCVVIVISCFLTAGDPRDSIFQIFSFAFGLALLALIWTSLRRANIAAEHKLPRYATVAETLRYSVKITNRGTRPLHNSSIEETPPDPRPSLEDFARQREPDEHQRNLFDRSMAYYRWQWLLARRKLFNNGPPAPCPILAPGESTRLQLQLTPQRRGIIPLNDLRVFLPDPLGIFQKCRKIPSKPSRLIVLPKRYKLPNFQMPGSAAFQIGGEETSNSIGTSGEFVGLRAYRPGDPLRQIHWKSWAHTGKPMVKELEDSFYPRYALILDTFPNSPNESIFEEMISVAASFLSGLDHHESLLDLIFVSGKAHIATAGRGLQRTEKLMEILAASQPDPENHYDSLAKVVINHRDKMTSCLAILNGWDQAREDFIKNLTKADIVCVPIAIGEGPPPPSIPGYWLANGHIARDLLHLPDRLRPAT